MKRRLLFVVFLTTFSVPLCGCTSLPDYITNGFKVGPNYGRPPAPVANEWIDASDKRVRQESDDISKWWTVFNDPVLNDLICFAYGQNLTLRQAGFRVLEARALLGIAVGNIFPQTQQATGSYSREGLSGQTFGGSNLAGNIFAPGQGRFFSQWGDGFNLAWEIDFWGRFRRAIESANASLDFSVEDYDDALVTLLGEVATTYVQIRTTQERIKYATDNVKLERDTVAVVEGRRDVGVAKQLDVDQVRSVLAQTEAGIPELEISLRQSIVQMCVLLGIPPEDLVKRLGPAPTPVAPPDVVVGIPADLLRRRPDVRRAERQAAAQCAQIGVAESDFYPHIAVLGTVGYQAQLFKNLFRSNAFEGTIGPSFTWDILNYGRILNNVRFQDYKFQELVAAYQSSVLNAALETESGLVTFLKAQERLKYQAESVDYANRAVKVVLAQYEIGTVDITQLIQLEQNLVLQEDTLALVKGEIPTGLIQVYKALGGGWQLRLTGCTPTTLSLAGPAAEPAVPLPSPVGSATTPFPIVSQALPAPAPVQTHALSPVLPVAAPVETPAMSPALPPPGPVEPRARLGLPAPQELGYILPSPPPTSARLIADSR